VVPLRQPTTACLPPVPNVATHTLPKALMRQYSGLFDSLVRPLEKRLGSYHSSKDSISPNQVILSGHKKTLG
jgi:hypothetical protein